MKSWKKVLLSAALSSVVALVACSSLQGNNSKKAEKTEDGLTNILIYQISPATSISVTPQEKSSPQGCLCF